MADGHIEHRTKETTVGERKVIHHTHIYVDNSFFGDAFTRPVPDPKKLAKIQKQNQEALNAVVGFLLVMSVLAVPILLLTYPLWAILPGLLLAVFIWNAVHKNRIAKSKNADGGKTAAIATADATVQATSATIQATSATAQATSAPDAKHFFQKVNDYLTSRGWMILEELSSQDMIYLNGDRQVLVAFRISDSELGEDAVMAVIRLQNQHAANSAIVVTNSVFSSRAKALAERVNMELWDTYKLRAKTAR